MTRTLIAGGATGIGAAAALAFVAEGHDVVVCDVNAEGLDRLTAQSEGLAGRVATLELDLMPVDAAARAVAFAADVLGGIDCLFVNAAVLASARLEDWTAEMWDHSMALNLRLPFLLTQAALPHLRASANASVIFTSSTGALRGHAGMPAYHASKAGLLGLVRSLTDELSPAGIRVNALLPGWVDTPFNNAFWEHQADPEAVRRQIDNGIPMRRHGTASEVAGSILYLASESARYVTGTSLVVDGGFTAV